MSDFVGSPILESRIMGCKGNYAFSHSQNELFLETCFSHSGGGGGALNNLVPMKNFPGGCKVGQNRPRGNTR